MTEQDKCTKCGSPLSSSVRGGLCPACLLKRGLETNTVGYADDAQAEAAKRWTPPSIGQLAPLFPELDILELIGRGGMGAVYKAREKQLDRLVALKILPPEIGREPAFAQRFAREAQAMARLSHHNIVTIHSFGSRGMSGVADVSSARCEGVSPSQQQDRGQDARDTRSGDLYFFIMEYVDGLSLRQLLDRGTVSPKEALAIVPQICDALQYAHDRGIVHRDIKPENILLNRAGQVKIADFGLAKLVGLTAAGTAGPTATDAEAGSGGASGSASPTRDEPGSTARTVATFGGEKVMGTPQYMAPEQIDRPGEVDHRADIYSLGVVFYQMLTGELPKGKPGQVAGNFEPPSRRVLIDVRLDEVVLRALEKEPARRYQQVSEVRTQVETIVATPPNGGQTSQGAAQAAPSPQMWKWTFKMIPVRPWHRLVVVTAVRGGQRVINWPAVWRLLVVATCITLIGLGLSGVSENPGIRLFGLAMVAIGVGMFGGVIMAMVSLDWWAIERLVPLDPDPSCDDRPPTATASTADCLDRQAAFQRARKAVRIPAIGLIGVGWYYLAWFSLGVARKLSSANSPTSQQMPALLVGVSVYFIAFSVILWGGVRLLRLRNRIVAIVAAVLATAGAPLVFLTHAVMMRRFSIDSIADGLMAVATSPSCLLSLLAGMWALVVLNRRETIEAFAANESGASPAGEKSIGRSRRFSWLATIGAVWAAIGATVFLLSGTDWIIRPGEYQSAAWWQWLQAFPVLALASTSPFGATICGVVAISRIRHSAGQLCGLRLALFDALAFPLVAMDWLIWLGMGHLVGLWRHWAGSSGNGIGAPMSDLAHDVFYVTAGATLLCALADALIIRWAWRAARKPPGANFTPAKTNLPSAGAAGDRTPKSTVNIETNLEFSSGKKVKWSKQVPIVGVRDGRRVISWSSVVLACLVAAAMVAVGAYLLDLVVYRIAEVSIAGWLSLTIAAAGVITIVGTWIRQGYKVPIEQLKAMDAARAKSKTRRWVVRIITLGVGGLIVWSVWGPSGPPKPVLFTSPPADPQAAKLWNAIQLIGVIPDGGDDVLDAEGKLLGKTLGLGGGPWGPGQQCRLLVFDVPPSPELQWVGFPEVYDSQTGVRLSGSMGGWTATFQGKPRRLLQLITDRTYCKCDWFMTRTVPIDRIDITLKYFLPVRGKAACTFLGPFEVGRAVGRQEGGACTLTPTGSIWPDGKGTKFQFSATNMTIGTEDFEHVLAYDVDGRQHVMNKGNGGIRVSGNLLTAEKEYSVESLPLKQIAAITIGEEPQAKTFRNILIRYPDRPARDYAEYLDKMAAELGLTGLSPQELAKYDFKNADEALKVIDIVRGQHMERALWKIWSLNDFAALPQDVQDKVHRTAKLWADNGNPRLGLKGEWPEFVAPAMKVVGEDTRDRDTVARALQAYRKFTPQELDQIAAVLEQRDDMRGLYSLLNCLSLNKRRPGGQEALLRLARSDKPWLWWPAVGYLTQDGGLTLGQLQRDLQVKYLAKSNPELGLDPALAAEARTLLAKLPTAKLAALSTATLSEVMSSVAANLPRAEAQAVMLDLLGDMVDHWGDYQFEGFSPSTWWAIDRAVRYLNKWNNLKLGGIDADTTQETHDGNIVWPTLAKQVLIHFGRRPAGATASQPASPAAEKIEPRIGTLVDALGQPIPGATLDLQAAALHQSTRWPRPFDDGPRARVQTDAKGRFQIDWPLRRGDQQIYSFTGIASHPDYGAVPVTVHGSGVTNVLLVRKDSPQYERTLKGQVVNEAGQSVPGALVESNRIVSSGISGQGNAIADSTGRFAMYFLPYSQNDKTPLVPADAKYEVVARSPAGMDLFPVRVVSQSPMRLTLRTSTLRPSRLTYEVGQSKYAQGNELDRIGLTWVPPDSSRGTIALEARYITNEPVRLIPGQYRAQYHDGHGRSFEYLPVDIGEPSPEMISFVRPPAVTYRGQVVDGATGRGVAGAFVFTYDATRESTNLAMLFDGDWLNLNDMPDHPSLDDPGVKAIGRHYVVESIMRTDAQGRYELTRGQEQHAYGIIAFARDRLPIEAGLRNLKADSSQRAQVPTMQLFSAAYVRLQPQVPPGANVLVHPRWQYQDDGQPEWFQLFRKAMAGRDESYSSLDVSGPVRLFVPAEISLKLRFHTDYRLSLVPKPIDQVLKLSAGETKDLGVLEFVPQKPTPASRQTSRDSKSCAAADEDGVTDSALPATQQATSARSELPEKLPTK